MEEGYILFECRWTESACLSEADIAELNHWRKILFDRDLIGVTEDGIGFGNISARLNDSEFLISGTQTGCLENLTAKNYSKVTAWDIENNWVECAGQARASSESLSHAALYQADTSIGAVAHIHNSELWNLHKNNLPSTDPSVEAATPGMAKEMARLAGESSPTIIMSGHLDGIITHGTSLDECGTAVTTLHDSLPPQRPD